MRLRCFTSFNDVGCEGIKVTKGSQKYNTDAKF
jgi:hypothetical protein